MITYEYELIDVSHREPLDTPKTVKVVREKLGEGLWQGWTGNIEKLGEYDIHQAGTTGSSSYQAKAQRVCFPS